MYYKPSRSCFLCCFCHPYIPYSNLKNFTFTCSWYKSIISTLTQTSLRSRPSMMSFQCVGRCNNIGLLSLVLGGNFLPPLISLFLVLVSPFPQPSYPLPLCKINIQNILLRRYVAKAILNTQCQSRGWLACMCKSLGNENLHM